ncbi:hypothetical protein [Bosea beijingensis]|nr:hypothetical protein [Bosea sp. REN20]
MTVEYIAGLACSRAARFSCAHDASPSHSRETMQTTTNAMNLNIRTIAVESSFALNVSRGSGGRVIQIRDACKPAYPFHYDRMPFALIEVKSAAYTWPRRNRCPDARLIEIKVSRRKLC